MKTNVTKSTSLFDQVIEVATLGAVKAEPKYTATVRDDDGCTGRATSNDKAAAVASALSEVNRAHRER